MTIRINLLGTAAAIAIVLPVVAFASEGFFLGANLGFNMPGNSRYDQSGTINTVDSNAGFAGMLSGGYQFENNWRVQAEFGARMNSVGGISGAGSAAPRDGNVDVYSLMADAVYGVPTGTKFTPYVGAGVGVAHVGAKDVTQILGSRIDDSDTVFAYQGIAGVEYDIKPNLKAALDYRYFRTADVSFKTDAGNPVDADYEDHTISLGLRYLFPTAQPAAEPPPPAPAPVMQPAAPPPPPSVPNNYIVFFDFDRASLSGDAERIVAAAAANAQQAKATTIEVTGYADRSGSARYNLRLSQRRAESVKQALLARGVSPNEIDVRAEGENNPLVPTADGVREAQNRRVQIVLK